MVQTKRQTKQSISTPKILKYYLWGIDLDCKSFVLTPTRKNPIPKKYCYLLFELGCILSNSDYFVKDNTYPHIGDVCFTNDNKKVKIVSID